MKSGVNGPVWIHCCAAFGSRVTLLEVDTEGKTIRVIPEGTKAHVPGDDVVLMVVNLDPTAVHETTIGLDLGAVTPQEIAVSITAELIAVRRGKAEALKSASLRWFPNLKALR